MSAEATDSSGDRRLRTIRNPPVRKTPIEGWVVYRHFDDRGVLLYVGMTRRPKGREHSHRAYSGWHSLSARREEEHFATREEAERAEVVAIQTEGPVFNYEHAESVFYRKVPEYLNITVPKDLIEKMRFIDGLKRRGPLVRFARRRSWRRLV